ncbi:MAG: hypothetical protein LC650_01010 [Actinobacteria bacterium]|nr:hypothetical protein [Actinomycetota bacterium]
MSYTQVPLFSDNEGMDPERINAMIVNQQHFEETRVTMRYNAYGVTQTDQLKIAVGVTDANNPNGYHRSRWITVSGFFTPGTRPVGFASHATINARRSTVSIARRINDSSILDHTGLSVYIRYVNNTVKLTGPNYINWMLIGY